MEKSVESHCPFKTAQYRKLVHVFKKIKAYMHKKCLEGKENRMILFITI